MKIAKITEHQKKCKRVGHLSQDRYENEATEQDRYLLVLVKVCA